MINEFLQQKKGLPFGTEEHKDKVNSKSQLSWVMDNPELSLGPSLSVTESANSSSLESEANTTCRKRKCFWEEPATTQTNNIELQLKGPLPLDWEQCLDLQSGRMYYLNRKTLQKSWEWPKDQKLDLELNISTHPSSDGSRGCKALEDSKKRFCPSSNMVAVACFKCHLLVMLCRSSPSCPNCKYVHALPPPPPAMVATAAQQTAPAKVKAPKSLETLSLLN